MANKLSARVRARLEDAVNRYHIGPGAYGVRYMLTCLRLAGLRVTESKPKRAKKASSR